MIRRKLLLLLIGVWGFAFWAEFSYAIQYRTNYLSFDMPPNWTCKLQGTEHVCRNWDNKKIKKEALIVVTAKMASQFDDLQNYQNYLSRPRTYQDAKGRKLSSKVYSVSKRIINQQPWVDSLHWGSEMGNHYTRYLATRKENLAILITLTAHQKSYTKYSGEFIKVIQSLNATTPPKSMTNVSPGTGLGKPLSTGGLGSTGTPTFPAYELDPINEDPPVTSNSNKTTKVIAIAVLIACAILYMAIKK